MLFLAFPSKGYLSKKEGRGIGKGLGTEEKRDIPSLYMQLINHTSCYSFNVALCTSTNILQKFTKLHIYAANCILSCFETKKKNLLLLYTRLLKNVLPYFSYCLISLNAFLNISCNILIWVLTKMSHIDFFTWRYWYNRFEKPFAQA